MSHSRANQTKVFPFLQAIMVHRPNTPTLFLYSMMLYLYALLWDLTQTVMRTYLAFYASAKGSGTRLQSPRNTPNMKTEIKIMNKFEIKFLGPLMLFLKPMHFLFPCSIFSRIWSVYFNTFLSIWTLNFSQIANKLRGEILYYFYFR